MVIGLGTGTTVAYLLPALASRKLSIRCVATSPRTRRWPGAWGCVWSRSPMDRLDLAIDGADQISPEGWLVKGGGGAHREKLVAITAERFVVIADSTKLVPVLHAPVLWSCSPSVSNQRWHDCVGHDVVISLQPERRADRRFLWRSGRPSHPSAKLEATPGIMSHGLFPPRCLHHPCGAGGRSPGGPTIPPDGLVSLSG